MMGPGFAAHVMGDFIKRGALLALVVCVGAGVALWRIYVANEMATTAEVEKDALQERLIEMQKRTAEVEKALDSMTRDATQFHDELEACQREKGVEWRERMQAVCAGYTTEVTP